MPLSQAEQDVLYEEGVRRREEAAKKDSLAAAAPAPGEKKPFGIENMDASNVMKSSELDNPAKALTALDNAARTIAGPMGDALAGTMNSVISGGPVDENILYEAAKTRMAKQQLDANMPGSANALGTMGDVGKIMAIPGAAFATPIRASMTGAAIAEGDTFFDRLDKGEPVNTDAEEYLNNGISGAGGGFLGYHIGKLIGNSISRFVGKDPSITKAAEDAVKVNKKIADEGNQKLISSGVAINPMGQNRLLRRVEKDLGSKYELNPKTTKEAWKALNILRDRVGQGADITLDNFNALRQAVGRSIYSDSGILSREVNSRDLQIVDDIYKHMTKFATELPITRQFVRSGGNLKQGMEGWNQMTKFQQTQARSEKVAELITNAEAKSASATRKKALDQALQDEFNSMFATKTGRDMGQRMFTPEQLKVMKKIAEGDISQKIFSTLDKWLGGSLLAPLFRGIQSVQNAAFQSEESRLAARKIVSAVGGTPLVEKIGPRWGVASVTEAKRKQQP